jgi:LPS export ABC transporter protein LptC
MMGVVKRRILYVVLSVFIVSAVAAVIFLVREPKKALLQKMAEKVDLHARDVHYTQVGSAGMKWEITADSASYQKKGEIALFEKIHVRLVMKDGRTVVMSGDKGTMNTLTKDMTVEGNVDVTSGNGEQLKTERLFYRDKTQRIETDQPVVMNNGQMRIRGVGMVLDLKGEKLTLLSRVRSESSGN